MVATTMVALFISEPVPAQTDFPNPTILTTLEHDSDLVLTGNQVMTIENTHLKVDGSITLQDSSQLIIRQSVIELLGDPGKKRSIWLRDSSALLADTVIFGGLDLTTGIDPSAAEAIKPGDILADHDSRLVMNNCFSLLQSFLGNSEVTIRHSYLVQEPLGLVHVEGNADVLVEDSYVGAFFIGIPDSTPIVIDSLIPGYFEYWSARESIYDGLAYNLVLKRTEVMENTKGYKGGMEIGWNIPVNALNTFVTISNSRLNKLIIGYPKDEPAFLSDLVIGQPVSFDLNNIHLINTEIQTQWGIFMEGGPAEIINSEGLFIFMTGGSGDILVFNSEVGEIDPRDYTGTLIYENSTWLGGYEIFDNSHIKIIGNVRMLPTVPIFDASSTLTRTYNVVMQDDRDGTPFGNVDLTLRKDNNIIWKGITDMEGKVNFDITFDRDNADQQWILFADTATFAVNKTISILISNPVTINLEQVADSLPFRPVLHVDGSHSGFPDGTRESPYPTIQEGIDNAGGSVVYVHAGIYPGDVPPGDTRGGIMLKDSVELVGAGADSTILIGDVNAEGAKGAGISRFTIEDGIHSIGSDLSLQNSVISGFEGTAVWGTNTHFYLVNNVLSGNGEDAIFLHDSSTAVIKNNIIVRNDGFGINGVETATAIIDYNNIWDNLENYHEFLPAGPNGISEDPKFVDVVGGDFHLVTGSPCIDSGDPDPAFNDPDGSRNDMGAFGGPEGFSALTRIDELPYDLSVHGHEFRVYPNPFQQQTQIYFDLPEEGRINLSVYTLTGQKVITLLEGWRDAGPCQVSWDGRNENGKKVSEGVYICQLVTSNIRVSRKCTFY